MSEGGPYRLHVAVDRGRGPVYVLLHGINGTGHDWDTAVTAMGFDRRCIAVDELGYGRSPKPLDIDYTVEDHVAALKYTIDGLGIDEPFVLVGYSMGGPIALHYAATHREDVERLVLISAPFYLDPEEIGQDAYASAVFQSVGHQAGLALVASAGFENSGVYKKLKSEDVHLVQDLINAQDLDTDWQILQKNVTHAIVGPDFAKDLPRVKAPITFMIGEHDIFIVSSQIETLRERYAPNMEIRYLADLKADHMLLENIPTVIADEIVRWEDRRLAVAVDRGEGDVLLFLHGIENDGTFWNETANALAKRHRAISLDLLGFGYSPKPLDIPYDYVDQCASIEATLEALLPQDATMTVVGHSLGSLVAAAYARRHPERVTRLVLCAPPLRDATHAPGEAVADKARAAFMDEFHEVRERGARLARKGVVKRVLGPSRLDRYEPSLRSLRGIVEQQDLIGDLAAIPQVPVTVAYGTRDPFAVPAYVEALREARSDIEVVQLEAGHDLAHDKPLEVIKLIDPEIPEAQAVVGYEKAKSDRKLRPRGEGLAGFFKADALLLGFRGLVYLAFGVALLLADRSGDVRLLQLALGITVIARSVSTLAGLITTRTIRQERAINAVMGVIGLAVGVFLTAGFGVATVVLVIVVAAYLVSAGVVNLVAYARTSPGSRRRARLLAEGLITTALGVLLLAGSPLAARLTILVIAIAALAAGVALLTYAAVEMRMRRYAGARI